MTTLDQMGTDRISYRCAKCLRLISEHYNWFCLKCIEIVKQNIQNIKEKNLTVLDLSKKLELHSSIVLQILWDLKEDRPNLNTIIDPSLLNKVSEDLLKEEST